jgi:hypothetical protein
MVDADLLSQFHQLPRSKQAAVAAAADSKRDIVSRQIRSLAQTLVVF